MEFKKINNSIITNQQYYLPIDWFPSEIQTSILSKPVGSLVNLESIDSEMIRMAVIKYRIKNQINMPKRRVKRGSVSYNTKLITPVMKLRDYCISNFGGKTSSEYLFLNHIISIIPSAYVVGAKLVQVGRGDVYYKIVNNFTNFIDKYIQTSKTNKEMSDFISFFLRSGDTSILDNFICSCISYETVKGVYDQLSSGEANWFEVQYMYDSLCCTMAGTFYALTADFDVIKAIYKHIFNYDMPSPDPEFPLIDKTTIPVLLSTHRLGSTSQRDLVKKSFNTLFRGLGDTPAVSLAEVAGTLNEIDALISDISGVPHDSVVIDSHSFAGWGVVTDFINGAVQSCHIYGSEEKGARYCGHLFNLIVNTLIAATSTGIDKSQKNVMINKCNSLWNKYANMSIPTDNRFPYAVNASLFGKIPAGHGNLNESYFPQITGRYSVGTPGAYSDIFPEICLDYNFVLRPEGLSVIQFHNKISGTEVVRVVDFYANSNSLANEYAESLSNLDYALNLIEAIDNDVSELIELVDQIDSVFQ